jgi:phosphoribosylaminoimidazole carboxylase PurE protein
MSKVAIIVGSDTDLVDLEAARPYLDFFGIKAELRVISAHRQHAKLVSYLESIANSDIKVIIACAGMAAHLPGVIAALSHLPVIGVPLEASSLKGMDALLSIVQMPKGIPVATMAIGKAGIINAVVYAVRILAISDKALQKKLEAFRKKGSKL